MKRTDLAVGQDYLWSRRTDWLSDTYGSLRVTVLDTQPWSEIRSYTRKDREHTLADGTTVHVAGVPASSGNGVLVRTEPEQLYPKGRTLVVPLSHLRGGYAEAKAQQATAREAREARQAAERRHADERRQAQQVRVDRVAALTGSTHGVYGTGHGTYDLSTDVLDRLLALAEQASTTTEGK